jgi:hypothetical protein
VLILLNALSLRAHRAAQSESELKGARKGLSAVLPAPRGGQSPGLGGGNTGNPSAPVIPGLGKPAPQPQPQGSGK